LFRGASAFVHPTSIGIEPFLVRAPGAFLVTPSRMKPIRVLELCTMHLSVLIGIASIACPELIDEAPLQTLADLANDP